MVQREAGDVVGLRGTGGELVERIEDPACRLFGRAGRLAAEKRAQALEAEGLAIGRDRIAHAVAVEQDGLAGGQRLPDLEGASPRSRER